MPRTTDALAGLPVGTNVVILRGHLSRPPEERELPSGDRLLVYDVTMPADARPADTARVVWFGGPPSALGLEPDEEVVVVGRVRRRFYKAAGFTQSQTDVVADAVVPARQAKRAAAAVQAAVGRLGAGPGG
jgi:single-stranded DNA-binding protein